MSELIIVSHSDNHPDVYVWAGRNGWLGLRSYFRPYVWADVIRIESQKYRTPDKAQGKCIELRDEPHKYRKHTWRTVPTGDKVAVGQNAGFVAVEEAFLPSGRLDWEAILGLPDRW